MKGGVINFASLFVFINFFLYLYNMEQFIHEAELIGSRLEQQYYEQQVEQIKQQLILNLKQ